MLATRPVKEIEPLAPAHVVGFVNCVFAIKGGVESASVIGPTILDTQPFRSTEILLYVPADKLAITTTPVLSEVILAVACGVVLKE